MDFQHKPVLLAETLGFWASAPAGVYVDGTLGGGGHSAALLELLPQASLIGIDQDEDALAAAASTLAPFAGRVQLVHDNFSHMADIAKELAPAGIAGILLDIGVSSHQLDQADRGFSYQQDAPLDMRMDRSAGIPTAADLVNTLSEEDLANLIYRYGEERYSRRIAHALVTKRQDSPVTTTAQLAWIVKGAMPHQAKQEQQHPAKRTFQALRIGVNHELDVLEQGLDGALQVLQPGGHLAVITFHSLEDRIVKEQFRAWAKGCTCPPDLPICRCGKTPAVLLLNRKPVIAQPMELTENPRARSAKLRAVAKLEA